jgi:hypothetical protein
MEPRDANLMLQKRMGPGAWSIAGPDIFVSAKDFW